MRLLGGVVEIGRQSSQQVFEPDDQWRFPRLHQISMDLYLFCLVALQVKQPADDLSHFDRKRAWPKSANSIICQLFLLNLLSDEVRD